MDEFEQQLAAAFQANEPARTDVQAAVAARVEAYEKRRRDWLIGSGAAGVAATAAVLVGTGVAGRVFDALSRLGVTSVDAAVGLAVVMLLFGGARMLAQDA
jgi:hypothetical protein